MKKLSTILLVCIVSLSFGQEKTLTKASLLIKDAELSKIVCDYSYEAKFNSGLGEYMNFFPAQIYNLKTGEAINALKFETKYQTFGNDAITESGFIDIDEIGELISFLKTYVEPDTKKKLDTDTGERFVFISKELEIDYILEYRIGKTNGTKRILEFKINDRPYPSKYFWTSSQIKKISEFITTLEKTLEAAK